MQICILGFKGSHAADDAYAEVLELEGQDNRWLLEVATIARPRVGRVKVGVTFPDGETTTLHEGDLGEAAGDLGRLTGYYVSGLTGPFGSMFAAANGEWAGRALGGEAETRLFRVGDIETALPRDSSALVLVAGDDTCDALVRMFVSYTPEIIRSKVEPELRARLEALERRVQQSAPAETIPMRH
jgi:hypothetical protein